VPPPDWETDEVSVRVKATMLQVASDSEVESDSALGIAV
jgi:hypothetical protein